ncbi:chemotaxis protein CheW [Noviherbaspirillum sp. ST9]|uniref:chemotaxis protein CheW n=1 Tax=Noviherbaspirillum sp. ST9 TaxID=3401606 RepID=UPI003B58A9A6
MTESIGRPVSDCWNRVGVRGDRSCEKLATHTHCRNCDVHAAGARSVMQRALPAGYREEWAEYFSREESEQVALDRSALVFRIASEWLAFPAALAVTVAEITRPHRLPRRSGGALDGIVNIKGKLYPAMSLAALLSISGDHPIHEDRRRVYPRLVVMELGGQHFALPVDDLYGIHRYAGSDVQAVPTTVSKGLQRYLTGVLAVGEKRIGCLDADLVGFNFASALR